MRKRSTTLKWMGLSIASLSAVLAGPVMAGMEATSEGGIKVFNSADSAYWGSIGGRLNLDEAIFSGNATDKGNNFSSGANIRRALVKFAGGLGDSLSYNLTLNFDGTNVGLNDLWLGASADFSGSVIDKAWVRVGQFTPPTSIDDAPNYGTLNNNVFMESALATNAFSVPSQVLGLQANASFVDMAVLSAAIYHPSKSASGNTNFGNTQKADRLGGSLRLTVAPIHEEGAVFHVGALGRYQEVNKDGANGTVPTQDNLFWTTPELQSRQVSGSNLSNLLLNTGTNNIRARSYNVVTAEALGIWGPLSVEGEYYKSAVQRVPTSTTDLGTLQFNGWHVQAAYVLTGEARGYDFATGTLRNPTPAEKCGAWELAARYSVVDLRNRDIQGGAAHNATLGLNWFATEHVYAAANYIRANIKANANALLTNTTVTRQLDMFGLRLGVAF